ncbi:MAG: anti-sigma factor [Ferruginibacter sp.]
MKETDIISSGLLELYATGLASEAEMLEVEEAVSQSPEVAEEFSRIERSLEAYAFNISKLPDAAVKHNLDERLFVNTVEKGNVVQMDNRDAKVYSISPAWKWVAAASIILLIGSAILNFKYYNEARDNMAAKEAADNSLLAQQTELDKMNSNFQVIQSKYSEPVSLHGLPAAPDAAAKIFWMKNTGEVYVDPSNLPPAPAGKQYQLWGMVDGKPVDGGMILDTKKGNRYEIQKMKSFGSAQAFAITLETSGGNPTPKGEMYVMGEL